MSTTHLDRIQWIRWVASFIGFPLAGLAAEAAVGPIDTTASAFVGGLAAGATLGAVQAVALRATTRRRLAWIGVTGIGFSIGLGIGATAVDFDTDAASLTLMGLSTGAVIGLLQMLVLDAGPLRRAVWALSTPALWALGWAITSQVISDTERQYANFGASGALVATILGGFVLSAPRRSPHASRASQADTGSFESSSRVARGRDSRESGHFTSIQTSR